MHLRGLALRLTLCCISRGVMTQLREEAITCSSVEGVLPERVRSYEGACSAAVRHSREPRAYIKSIDPLSPADDAGFTEGCWILKVNGRPLRDAIDWMWETSGDVIELYYEDTDGDQGIVELFREPGESWGFEFDGAIYDNIRRCRNACTFCFMAQLPDEARPSLVLRDDDFRLSFLQGTFVTLTNIKPEDENRIIEQHISPLRFSLHCISPELRRQVIGRHAQHGIEVAERLLAAGIEFHTQIVLMPGVNDGDELDKTLSWAAQFPGILTVGIVPVGFTKYQERFTESFNDQRCAQAVIRCIQKHQSQARATRGGCWVYAADEFYRNAFPNTLLDELPPACDYGNFEMFEDGIGIVRSFVDDWRESNDELEQCAAVLKTNDSRVLFVAGCAQREFFAPLLKASPLDGFLIPLFVKNEYFGGNVDVTGLLCGCDIVAALKRYKAHHRLDFAVIPSVVFNDDMVTLDDMTVEEMIEQTGVQIHVVSCNASKFLPELSMLVQA